MHVHLRQNSKVEEISKLLLDIVDENISEFERKIYIPNTLGDIVKDLNSLTDKIIPNIHQVVESSNSAWLWGRAILTPSNDKANNINLYLLPKMPGAEVKYESVGSILEVEYALHYPVEFLYSLEPRGIHLIFCT